MKCVSCETEINPKWKHAIDRNVCPFCGECILEERLKNLLTSLRETMDALQGYPDQLSDWLLSNFNFIKTDSPDLILYMPKEAVRSMKKELDDEDFEKRKSIIRVKTENGEEEVLVEKVQSQAKTKSFHDRASAGLFEKDEVPKNIADKTQYYKAITKKIKSESMSGGVIPEEGLMAMVRSSSTEADPDTVAEFQSVLSGGDIIASGLQETATGDDDDIPAVVAHMANRAAAKKSNGVNERDLQSLNEMQNKVKNAQKKFSSGGGGFSRA